MHSYMWDFHYFQCRYLHLRIGNRHKDLRYNNTMISNQEILTRKFCSKLKSIIWNHRITFLFTMTTMILFWAFAFWESIIFNTLSSVQALVVITKILKFHKEELIIKRKGNLHFTPPMIPPIITFLLAVNSWVTWRTNTLWDTMQVRDYACTTICALVTVAQI